MTTYEEAFSAARVRQLRPWSAREPLALWAVATSILLAPVGLVLSISALRKATRYGGGGKSIALLGVAVSSVLICVSSIALMAVVGYNGGTRADEVTRLSLAIEEAAATVQEYRQAHGSFPESLALAGVSAQHLSLSFYWDGQPCVEGRTSWGQSFHLDAALRDVLEGGCVGTSGLNSLPPPVEPIGYPSLGALRDVYAANGGECASTEEIAPGTFPSAASRCGDGAVLTIYGSIGDRNADRPHMMARGSAVLVGVNWAIAGDPAVLGSVRSRIGGEMIDGTPGSTDTHGSAVLDKIALDEEWELMSPSHREVVCESVKEMGLEWAATNASVPGVSLEAARTHLAERCL